MEITEVRIKLVERSSERLRAFCSVTLDGDFVIRDLKIIDGTNGAFVAMPSRKLADRCSRCGSKNHLRSKYCNECGQRLNENRAPKDSQGRAKLHADVAHPINAACRERIQKAVIEAFTAEVERAKSPDYRPARYDDYDVDIDDELSRVEPRAAAAVSPPAAVRASEKVEEEEEEAAAQPAAAAEEEGEFSDYNSLIAELKRDAAGRREKHEEQRGPAGGAPAEGGQQRRGRDDRGRQRGGRERREDRPAAGVQSGPRDSGRPGGQRQDRAEPPAPPPPAREPAAPPAPRGPAPEPTPPPPAREPAPQPAQPPADDDFAAGL